MGYAKEDLIFNCVALGMDLQQAYLAVELTEEEMDIMEADPVFQRKAKAKSAILERDLLQKLNNVMDMNLAKGNSKELRYKLGAVNSKWRNQGGNGNTNPGTINIFTKEYDLEKEDTVEIHGKKKEE
jgi:hypothetical protein